MTNTKKEVYHIGKLRFVEGNLFEAFDTLVKGLRPFSFLEYFSKKEKDKTSWLRDESVRDFFWKEYLTQNNSIEYFKKGIVFQKLLQFYFTRNRNRSLKFEEILIIQYPAELILAIRLNRLYLDDNKQVWLKKLLLPQSFFLHKVVWDKFYKTEQYLWGLVEDALNKVMDYSIEEILALCCIWLEEERYKFANGFNGNLSLAYQELGDTYGKLIDLLQNSKWKFTKFDKDAFHSAYIKILKTNESTSSHKVNILLATIRDWVKYRTVYIDTYSCDLNSDLILENEQIILETKEKAFLKWKQDGTRYEFVRQNYLTAATEVRKGEFENISGRTAIEKVANYNIQIDILSLLFVLEDLGITEFKIKDVNYEVESVIAPLLVYSSNRELRYNRGLWEISNFERNWKEDYLVLQLKNGVSLDCSPYILHTQDEFARLNEQAIGSLSSNQYKDVFSYFTFSSSNTNINRFVKGYSVYTNPLLKIGDVLFCPIFFFSSTTWFYAILQKAIDVIQPLINETKMVESSLKLLFEQCGYKAISFDDKTVNTLDGDVDLIVEDDNTTILIQIKRSSLRTTLPEYLNEKLNAELKAAQQLNDIEIYFLNDDSLYKPKNSIKKWIVSTSLEGINEIIEGCRKISYFELVWLLRQSEMNNLNDIIAFLEEDRYIDFLIHFYKEELNIDLTVLCKGENKLPLGDTKDFV